MIADTKQPPFITTYRRFTLYNLLMVPVRTMYFLMVIRWAQFFWFTRPLPDLNTIPILDTIATILILLSGTLLPYYLLVTDGRWLQATLSSSDDSNRLLWGSSVLSVFFLFLFLVSGTISIQLYLLTALLAFFFLGFTVARNAVRWHLSDRVRRLLGLSLTSLFVLIVLMLFLMPERSRAPDFNILPEAVFVGWLLINGVRIVRNGSRFHSTRTRNRRHQYLRNLAYLTPRLSWRKQINAFLRNIQSRYRWFPLFLLFLSPLPIFGAVLLMENEVVSSTESKALILAGGFLFTALMLLVVASSLGGVIQQLRDQHRYVVIPFTVMGKHNDEVRAIANLMTYTLVNELQRIGTLLSWRQSETATASVGHDVYPMFVASGHEHNFVEELRHLKSLTLDNGAVRFPLGQFLERLIDTSAIVRVQGTIQQRENGAIEIWIQLTRRDSPTISAEQVVVTGNSTADINEITADAIARELACNLVLQLSEGQPLAADAKSLEQFLAGVDAMIHRKWWLAIAHYRNALAKEQTAQAKYGLLHYHLGSAFMFQGELEKGREHLEMAEQSGLLLAELHYMLARAQLYENWNQLHTDAIVFEDIVRRSKKALELNPEAAEVLHLLGALYYHRGRLSDRCKTFAKKDQKAIDKLSEPNNRWDYQRAEAWLRRAEQAYDRSIHLGARTQAADGVSRELNQILQSRMMVTHQIADTLRGQQSYILADLTYRDVEAIYPENLRNLVDVSKTYCLAGNWQTAYAFLSKRVLRNKLAQWNADANFYMAWSYLGGVADGSALTDFDNTFYRSFLTKRTQSYPFLLKEALRYLDFAIVQRPRYLARWGQNDWFKTLDTALGAFKQNPIGNLGEILNSPQAGQPAQVDLGKVFASRLEPGEKDNRDGILLYQSILWLVLRLCNYQFQRTPPLQAPRATVLAQQPSRPTFGFSEEVTALLNHHALQIAKTIEGTPANGGTTSSVSDSSLQSPAVILALLKKAGLLNLVEQLEVLRDQLTTSLLNESETMPLEREYVCLNLAERALDLWIEVKSQIGIPLEPAPADTFKFGFSVQERYHVDLVAETALITIRLLAEGGAYPEAARVVEEALTYLARWREEWGREHGKRRFLFSSQIFRYQLASLYAWMAYIQYQRLYDKETHFRERLAATPEELESLAQTELSRPTSDNLVAIQQHLRVAFTLMRTHPLAMYVQALIRRQQNLYIQAAEELQFLLQTIAPFDPSRFVRRWGPRPKPSHDLVDEQLLIERLDLAGKTNGARQFDFIVNEARIHAILAEIYEAQNQPDLAVDQSRAALMWQRPHLYSTQDHLALAKRLAHLERFAEADAILDTIRVPGRESKMPLEIVSHYSEIETLRCVLATRRGNHEQSLEMGRELALRLTAWDINTFVAQWTGHRIADANSSVRSLIGHYHAIKEGLNQVFTESTITSMLTAIRLQDYRVPEQNNGIPVHHVLIPQMPDVFGTEPSSSDPDLPLIVSRPKNYVAITDASLKKLLASVYMYMVVMGRMYTEESQAAVQDAVWSLMPMLCQNPFMSGRWLRQQLNEGKISLQKFLTLRRVKPKPIEIIPIIRTKIMYRFLEYQVNHLLQIAELSNTVAYNHSELDIRHGHAFHHVRYAILIARLVESLGQGVLGEMSMRKLRADLAQYHDTLGWVYYRAHTSFVGKHRRHLTPLVRHLQHTLTGLEDESDEQSVENDLFTFPLLFLARDHLEWALRYDTDRAIFYYHLARTHTTNLEYKWQGIPNKRDLGAVARAAPAVMMHLRKADRYWTRAKRLDTSNRLHTRLVWLRQRIQEYRDAWNTRQVTQFSGKFQDEERDFTGMQDPLHEAQPNEKSPV